MANPNLAPEDRSHAREGDGAGLWLIGALIVIVLAGGLFYAWSSFTNPSSSAANASRSTTAAAPAKQTTGQAPSSAGGASGQNRR